MSDHLMILPPQSEQSKLAIARKSLKGLYADYPGTGPEGQTCGSCKHMARVHMANVYRKCGLCRPFWTGGGGTDVKARAPACSKWEACE